MTVAQVCALGRVCYTRLQSILVGYAIIIIFIFIRGERCSPLLQYCSSRLVLSYRLPHEATLSDILPFPFLFLPPLSRVLCPSSTPLSLFLTPLPLSVSPTFMEAPHTPTPASSPSASHLLSRGYQKATRYVITNFRFVFSN